MMSRVFLTIIIVAVLLFILSLTKITLRLRYWRKQKNGKLALEYSLWLGILFYKLEIPLAKIKVEKPKLEPKPKRRQDVKPLFWPVLRPAFKIWTDAGGKSKAPVTVEEKEIPVPGPASFTKMLLNTAFRVRKHHQAFIYLTGRTRLRRFQWRTEIGTGEPSLTGIINGIAWGFKGFALTHISRLFSPGGEKPFVAVVPNFQRVCFNTFLDCIFEVRIGYIILTGFKAFAVKFK